MRFILCMNGEEASFFAQLLGNRSGACHHATSKSDLRQLVDDLNGPTRLISFCSDLIIPADVIDALGGECFNFHSGPPDRPGYRPVSFAAAEGERDYGVTFHRLVAKIDAGTIYATRRFVLPADATEETISELAYAHLLELARVVAPMLVSATAEFRHNGETWQGAPTTRADYAELKSRRADFS